MKALIAAAFIMCIFIPTLARGQQLDSDGDGLADRDEVEQYATDPFARDSDGDSFADGEEIAKGFSPRHGDRKKLIRVDSDSDYLNDAWELAIGTQILNADTDGDLYLDGTEVAAGFDPLNAVRVQVEKRINVDLSKQQLEYYFGEIKLAGFSISSGLPGTPTPKGVFSVLAKVPLKYYGGAGYDYPNTKWNLHFTTGKARYYIHGAYWHNDFGRPKSHGCVNVHYENMESLYWFAQLGTRVEIR